jgi:hypothetical protein
MVEEVDPNFDIAVGENYDSIKPDENGNEPESSMRNIIAFGILGLLNNFYYVVFLSAAEDLSKECTGCILLANIIPSLFVGMIAPFFMHFM